MDQKPPQNQNTTEPQAPLSSPPNAFPRSKNTKLWIIISILAVLVIAGAAFGYAEYVKNQNNLATNNGNVSPPLPTVPPIIDYPVANPPGTPSSGSDAVLISFDSSCENPFPPVASRSGLVQWVQPKKQDGLKIFKASPEGETYFAGDTSYLVGHITGGKYAGGDMLLTIVSYLGMGFDEDYDHIVRLDGKYYFLGSGLNHSPDQPEQIKPIVNLTIDKDFKLSDFDFPETLHTDNPKADFSLVKGFYFFASGKKPFCGDHYVKAFTDPVLGDVYTDTLASGTPGMGDYYNPQHGYYVKGPDSTLWIYSLNIAFVGSDNKTPLVTWSNGQKNVGDYSYQAVGGCGASQFLDIQNVKLSDLVKIGTTFDGQAIYAYKDMNAAEQKKMYDEIYIPDGQTKPSYAAFLADHPIFFWQDPFGEFVRFKIMKYQPLAECAKPVIYLYPQKTEKVSVNINPLGGMTKSDPAYGSGWNVIADPLSNIKNLADGQTYPYLFWEGRGGMYRTPDKGFVVQQTNVHEFLQTKLHELGLNEKESKDFMEFWEPKMQNSPYYFVTFMGNSVMDGLAPLYITPKPDTVIRLLMDFTPLEHPINVQGYNIRTPERKGFTVVEWGGVLR